MKKVKSKRWRILSKKKALRKEEIIKILLLNRGLKTKKEIENFFNPPSPYKFSSKDLGIDQKEVAKAIKRINRAISKKEKIIIYGDFDTDGICATAILWETLYGLGANVLPFIPTRTEGYGLKNKRIKRLKKEGVKLLITVDNGIVADKQVSHAKEIGLDVIITDHHAKGKKKPKAEAIVHTVSLSGSGISWFLACQIAKKRKNKKLIPGLDLVTIATIADMVPLIGPNRAIVKHGLKKLKDTKRVGLQELFKVTTLNQEKITAYEVGFVIAPRINASGRLDDPLEALRLLCTPNSSQASFLAKKLDEQNKLRQELTEKSYLFARQKYLEEASEDSLIFLYHESFEEGVVGLVASKLVEEFYRPAVVVSLKKEQARASARSIGEFNIIEAIRTCADILGAHGGHPKAAGFDIRKDNLEALSARLKSLASEKLKGEKLIPMIVIDQEINFSCLDFDFYQKLKEFEPFGIGNSEPLFLTKGVKVEEKKAVGAKGQHLKLRLSSSKEFDAIGFGMGERLGELSFGRKIDIVYCVLEDTYNKTRKLQLRLKDFRVEK